MMMLTVYSGKNCPKCPAAKQLCETVAKERGLGFEVRDIEEHMIEALQLQIASTPSIVLDGEVLFRSTVPDRAMLLAAIEARCDP